MFDRCGTQLNALQYGGIKDVDTSIDAVSDELYGFLDESINTRGVVGLVNDDTVFRRFLDFGNDNCSLVAVGFVEGGEFGERIVADDI